MKLTITLLLICLLPTKVLAQIVPDNSLPNNSQVTDQGGTLEINGGTEAGRNLFHSFESFSVPPNVEALFNSTEGIENIIGRVTGIAASEIAGEISADANLFLINPNGIIFNDSASLDISGTFTATTADQILFEDGNFSAVNPSESILSIEMPLGVQLGSEAASINVEGEGNSIYWDEEARTITEFTDPGLEADGIEIYAGAIELDGGSITGENITLVAQTNGTINFGTVSSELTPGDVVLNNEAAVNASNSVFIFGKNVEALAGSGILALNGGKIDINAAQDLIIAGEHSSEEFPSYISTDVIAGDADGGDINITAQRAIAGTGGQANVATFGSGKGGNLNITAENQILAESGGSFTSSAFLADTAGTGNGGNINLDSPLIVVNTGAQIGSTSFGEGKAGNINIEAEAVEIDGSEFGFVSEIFSRADGSGDGGKINLNTNTLLISNDGQLSVTSFDNGGAGEIDVSANQITIGDTIAEEDPNADTGIFASSGSGGTENATVGAGGNISIEANSIDLINQGLISSNSFSNSQGGNINLNAESLTIANDSQSFAPEISGQIASAARSQGNAGDISLNIDNLTLKDGGQIVSATIDSGNAGEINAIAKNVEITGFTDDGNSGIISSAIIGDGDGGNINLTTNNLKLSEGGTINASNFPTQASSDRPPGTGASGNVNINAPQIEINGIERDTSINAANFQSGGGSLNINAPQQIKVTGEKAAITVETLGEGNGGDITISTNELSLNNNGKVTSSATATGNAGNINITTRDIKGDRGQILAESELSGGGNITIGEGRINLNNNSLISTSVRDGSGGGGNLAIAVDGFVLLRNNSDIRANAFAGDGGNIDITSPLLFRDSFSDIDASSKFGLDGTVEITVEFEEELAPDVLEETVINPVSLITSACPIANENSFSYIGNGGIKNPPSSNQSVSIPWMDLKGRSGSTDPLYYRGHDPMTPNNSTDKTEATETVQGKLAQAGKLEVTNGKVELVATATVESYLKSDCNN